MNIEVLFPDKVPLRFLEKSLTGSVILKWRPDHVKVKLSYTPTIE